MREKGGVLQVGLTDVDMDAEVAAHYVDLKPGPYLRITVSDTGCGMVRNVISSSGFPVICWFDTTSNPANQWPSPSGSHRSSLGLKVAAGILKNKSPAYALAINKAVLNYAELKGDHLPVVQERVDRVRWPSLLKTGPPLNPTLSKESRS